jgi:thiamine-phosphate pyrophosphorylase
MTLAAAARRLNRGARGGGVPALLLLTDEDRLPDPAACLAGLGRAGGGLVLRYRDAGAKLVEIRRLRRLARRHGVPVLLAGPLRLARRLGLDGAHFAEARARATPGRVRRGGLLLTVAAHSPAALAVAARLGADAALLSPVFATASHPGARALGPLRLNCLASASRVPVIALGGLSARNAARLGRNVAGIAAIGALAAEIRRSGR